VAHGLGRPALAIVFDLPDALYVERNRTRPDRVIPEYAVVAQIADFRRALSIIAAEGFARVYELDSPEMIGRAVIKIEK
jgi:predicted kinase